MVKQAVQVEPYNHLVTFHIMDCASPHNAILGRNWLHKIKVVLSSYHQLLHYLAPDRAKEIKGDQSVMRYCTVESMNMIRKEE